MRTRPFIQVCYFVVISVVMAAIDEDTNNPNPQAKEEGEPLIDGVEDQMNQQDIKHWNNFFSSEFFDTENDANIEHRYLPQYFTCPEGGSLDVESVGRDKCFGRGEGLCRDGYRFGIVYVQNDFYVRLWHIDNPYKSIFTGFRGAKQLCVAEYYGNLPFLYVLQDTGTSYLACPGAGNKKNLPRLKIRPTKNDNDPKPDKGFYGDPIVKFRNGANDDGLLWEILGGGYTRVGNGCNWYFVSNTGAPTNVPSAAPSESLEPSSIPSASPSEECEVKNIISNAFLGIYEAVSFYASRINLIWESAQIIYDDSTGRFNCLFVFYRVFVIDGIFNFTEVESIDELSRNFTSNYYDTDLLEIEVKDLMSSTNYSILVVAGATVESSTIWSENRQGLVLETASVDPKINFGIYECDCPGFSGCPANFLGTVNCTLDDVLKENIPTEDKELILAYSAYPPYKAHVLLQGINGLSVTLLNDTDIDNITSLVLEGSISADVAGIEVGYHLMGETTPQDENEDSRDFLLYVLDLIETSPNRIVLRVREAGLQEIFCSLDMKTAVDTQRYGAESDPDFDDPRPSTVVDSNRRRLLSLTLLDFDWRVAGRVELRDMPATPAPAPPTNKPVGMPTPRQPSSDVSITASANVTAVAGLRAYLGAYVNIVTCKIRVLWFRIPVPCRPWVRAGVRLEGGFDFLARLEAEVVVSYQAFIRSSLWKGKKRVKTYLVGPCPICLPVVISYQPELSANIDFNLEITGTLLAQMEVGGGIILVARSDGANSEEHWWYHEREIDFQVEGKATLKVSAQFDYNIRIYEKILFRPGIEIGPQVDACATSLDPLSLAFAPFVPFPATPFALEQYDVKLIFALPFKVLSFEFTINLPDLDLISLPEIDFGKRVEICPPSSPSLALIVTIEATGRSVSRIPNGIYNIFTSWFDEDEGSYQPSYENSKIFMIEIPRLPQGSWPGLPYNNFDATEDKTIIFRATPIFPPLVFHSLVKPVSLDLPNVECCTNADCSLGELCLGIGGNRACVATPSASPSTSPTERPSDQPSSSPSESLEPSATPSRGPSSSPSSPPSETSDEPSSQPSPGPSGSPSSLPSESPSTEPSMHPSDSPTSTPSSSPSRTPSGEPSEMPSIIPSEPPSLSNQPTGTSPMCNVSVDVSCDVSGSSCDGVAASFLFTFGATYTFNVTNEESFEVNITLSWELNGASGTPVPIPSLQLGAGESHLETYEPSSPPLNTTAFAQNTILLSVSSESSSGLCGPGSEDFTDSFSVGQDQDLL